MKNIPMTPMQLAFQHLGELTNSNSGELIILASHLNVHRLRQAIGLALERHPLLNCVPKKRLGQHFWSPSPCPLPIDLRVHRTEEVHEGKLLEALWRNLWEEKLPESSRQVRFIYTMGPRRSYLQICAPHSVTDACSGNRLAADIAQAYTALSSGRRWSATKAQPLKRPVSEVFLGRLSKMERLKMMFEAVKRIFNETVTPGSGLYLDRKDEPGHTGVRITELRPYLLKETIHAARHLGVTAHSVFLLALTRARQEILGPEKGDTRLRVNDFATLRPFADRDLSDVFDVLVVPHQLDIDPTWNDETALEKISSQIRAKKNGAILPEVYRLSLYSMLAKFLPTRLTAKLVFRFVNKTDVAVTNPGRVLWEEDLARFGPVAVEDFVNFPHLLPPAKVVLIFTTFRNKLRVVQLFDPNTTPKEVEETLVDTFAAHLERLVAEYGDPRDLQKITGQADTLEMPLPHFDKRRRRVRAAMAVGADGLMSDAPAKTAGSFRTVRARRQFTSRGRF